MTLLQLETAILGFKTARDLAAQLTAVYNQMTQPPQITQIAQLPGGNASVAISIPIAVIRPIIRTRAEFQAGVAVNVAAQLGIDYTPPVFV